MLFNHFCWLLRGLWEQYSLQTTFCLHCWRCRKSEREMCSNVPHVCVVERHLFIQRLRTLEILLCCHLVTALQARKLVIMNPSIEIITCGVPQESILRPCSLFLGLWNITPTKLMQMIHNSLTTVQIYFVNKLTDLC